MAGARKRRAPTQRAGPDTEAARPRHRERRGPTKRAPGPDAESAGARQRERRGQRAPGPQIEGPGPGTESERAAGPGTEGTESAMTRQRERESAGPRHRERRGPDTGKAPGHDIVLPVCRVKKVKLALRSLILKLHIYICISTQVEREICGSSCLRKRANKYVYYI